MEPGQDCRHAPVSKPQMAHKLLEGTSVYYNLSSDGRRACNGTNTGENAD